MKFSTKLLALMAVLFLATSGSLMLLFSRATVKNLEDRIVGQLEESARDAVDDLDRYLHERTQETLNLAADPALSAPLATPQRLAAVITEYLRWHREYESASLYTMDRVRIADSAGRRVGATEASEGFWQEIAAGGSFASSAQPEAAGEVPTIHLAAVVRDAQGAPRGVVVTRIALGVLGEQLRALPIAELPNSSLSVDLVDRGGVILYSSHNPGGVFRETSPDWLPVRQRLDEGRPAGRLRYTNPLEATGEEYLFYIAQRGYRSYPGSGWTLIFFTPTRTVLAPALALRDRLAVGILVAGGLLFLVVYLAVRAFTQPIVALSRAAARLGEGDLEARADVRSNDELGSFAAAFNRMAAEIAASHRTLAAHAGDLERRVEERTEELLQANKALQTELSERARAQEALETRNRLLRMNADIGEALALGETLAAVLQRCAGHVVRDLDAAFVRIWTLGSVAGSLELRASAGEYTRLDGRHSRKVFGELKVGVIAKEQRPILTNAVIGDPDITDQEWARQAGMVAFAGYPLVLDGRTVGVLALFSRQPLRPFALAALETVADKVAAFIGRKHAEESLRVSEKRYRDLFDASMDGIYKTDAAGLFTSMNPAGARIFGYERPEEIVGRSALEYWRTPQDRDRFRTELLRVKSISAYRIHARRRDGSPLELESSSRILEGPDGEFLGIEGMLRDVTQRVRAEAEREFLLAELQEAAANIKTLSGLLPICAACKKIRDDKGTWSQIETYISTHSEAEFSHGLCPDCRKVYFPSVG